MYTTGIIDRVAEDKVKIDKLITLLSSGRLSYIITSAKPFRRAIQYLRENDNDELVGIVMKHRMYFEYKAKQVK